MTCSWSSDGVRGPRWPRAGGDRSKACPEEEAALAFCVEWGLSDQDEETTARSVTDVDPPPAGSSLGRPSGRRGKSAMSGRSHATATTASPAEHDVGVAIGRTGGVVVVSVHGYLGGDGDGGLEHVLRDVICEQGNLHVVVDANGLTGADTNGASVLMEACRVARRCGATLSIRNAPEAVRRVLDGCCVDHQVAAMAPAGLHIGRLGEATAAGRGRRRTASSSSADSPPTRNSA